MDAGKPPSTQSRKLKGVFGKDALFEYKTVDSNHQDFMLIYTSIQHYGQYIMHPFEFGMYDTSIMVYNRTYLYRFWK